jgi:predicted nucleotide-binding protein
MPIKEKRFTNSEIDLGLQKLHRRIAEVQNLDPRTIRHDDARVENIESNIRGTILNIFPEGSLEFNKYKCYEISYGTRHVSDSDADRQHRFEVGIPRTITMLEGLCSKLEEKRSELSQTLRSEIASRELISDTTDSRRVFVVHGRNSQARDAMFTFLRAIDLNPIEWSEAVRLTNKPNPIIGEILDTAFNYAQAVLVLMTPDDIAWLHPNLQSEDDPLYEKTPTAQARPNVLFEAGMAIGRFPDRTILVELGKIRPFSDIGGRYVVRLTNNPQKRQDLADSLITAKCPANISNRDWHTAGDFEACLLPPLSNSIQTQNSALMTDDTQSHTMSEHARTIITEVCKSPDGKVLILTTDQGQIIQINNKDIFVEESDPRLTAAWKTAMKELVQLEFLEQEDEKGVVFRITSKGYAVADEIKS